MRATRLALTVLLAGAAALAACDKARTVSQTEQVVTSCVGCHGGTDNETGAPPRDTSGRTATSFITVGSHTVHVEAGLDCSACHVKPGRIGDRGHIDGTPAVVFSPGSVASLGGGTAPSFNPATGTCSNVYCHGSKLRPGSQGQATTPTFTAPALAGAPCGSCHGTAAGNGAPAGHSQVLSQQDCNGCHPGTVDAGGAIIPAAAGGLHINGSPDINGGCNACHGDRSQTRGEVAGSQALFAPPVDAAGGTDPAKVGAHLRHVSTVTALGSRLSNPFTCAQCHVVPTAVPHNTPAAQVVQFGPLARTGGLNPTYTAVNGTCASTYCHGSSLPGGSASKSASWNAPAAAACGTCHFDGPTVAQALASGHPQEVSPGGPPIVANTQCYLCHPGTVNSSGNIVVSPTSIHVNGTVDFNHAAGWVAADGGDHGAKAKLDLASCASAACHGATFGALVGLVPRSCNSCHANPVAFVPGYTGPQHPTWQSECTFCHGDTSKPDVVAQGTVGTPPANAGDVAPPAGSQGESGFLANAVGAHQRHLSDDAVTGNRMANAFRCEQCHGTNVLTDAAHQGVGHVDGRVVIGWQPALSGKAPATTPLAGSYPSARDSTGLTRATVTSCANYCHGATLSGGAASKTVSWTSTDTAACGTCHFFPTPTYTAPSWHVANAAAANCASCHYAAIDKARHVNGVVDVPVALTCRSCHGSAANFAPPGAASAEAVDPTDPRVGAHQPHVAASLAQDFACTTCHGTVPTTMNHADGVVTVAWSALASGTVDTWSAGTPAAPSYGRAAGCATTYCHGEFKNGQLGKTVVWAQDITLTCNSCHGTPGPNPATVPGGSHPASGSCGTCHTGYTATTVNVTAHVNGRLDVAGLTCSSCHGTAARVGVATATALDALGANLVKAAPPVDHLAATTGSAVGAHLSHANQGATAPALSNALACTNCHVVPTSTAHSDGTSQVTFGSLATSRGAAPAPFNGTSCASTYCHGNFPVYGLGVNAINWGTTSPGTKLTCTQCHVNPAATPTYPHPANTTCATCHGAGYTATAVTASTHVNGVTNQTSYGCSQCHGVLATASPGVTAAAPASAAPGAGGTGVATTGAAVAATTPQYGAHRAHLEQSGFRAALGCATCHVVPAAGDKTHATGAGTGGAIATLTWSTLATGTVNAWGPAATPSYTRAGGCATTYCHGEFRNGQQGKTVVWAQDVALTCNSCHGTPGANPATPPGGTHPANATCGTCHTGYTGTTVNATVHLNGQLEVVGQTCQACHGTAGRANVATATALDALGVNLVQAAPPVDHLAASTGTAVGTHLSHANQGATAPALSNALACTNCHVVPTSTAHSDGTSQVTFGSLATSRGAAPAPFNGATHNCSSTYCHGNFPVYGLGVNSINWGTTSPGTKLTCTQCHVNPTTTPTYPHPTNATCTTCHGAGYTPTAVAAATHVNGVTNQTSFGCSQCHGVLATASPGVTAAAPNDAAPGAAGTGLATTGAAVAATTAQYGAHRAHLEQSGFRAALGCATCHVVPAAGDKAHATGAGTGGAIATLTWSTLASGTVDPWSSGTPATPSYTRAGGCASTYCHGQFKNGQVGKTVVWAQDIALTCNSCHGTAGANPATPPGGTHPANATCGTCHTGYTGTTVNAAVHLNGQLDVVGQSCQACHGTAGRANVATATALDAQGVNLVQASPPVDHLGAATGTAVGTHLSHANQGATAPALSNALACTNCHTVPTSTAHSDGTTQVTFGSLATSRGAVPTAFNGTTHNCSSTYCHGNFPTYGLGANQINWGTTSPGTKLTCTQCHVNPTTTPIYPHPANTTCATCHGAGYTATAVTAATHVNGATTQTTFGCSQCHGVLATASPGVTAAAPTNAAPGAAGTGVNTTGAAIAATTPQYGAHRAHLEQGGFRAALGCATCHVVPAAGDKAHATGAGTGGAIATLTWSTLASGTVDTWSSGTPATPSYTRAGGCASTYCHGQFKNGQTAKTVVWAQDIALTCNSCHGTAGANPATPPGGTHPANASCGTCHTGYTGTTVNAAVHLDGRLDVVGQSCQACHGTAGRANVATATALDAQGVNLVQASPPVDHLGAATGTAVGTHLSHANQGATAPAMSNALACTNCHVVPTSTAHSDGTTQVTFGSLATSRGAVPTAFNGATHNCASTYCHGNFPTYGLGANQINWGTTSPGTKLTCTQCHVNPVTSPTYPHPANATCATCHGAGYTATAVTAATHVNGVRNQTTFGCSQCHGVLSTASPGVVSGAVNAAPGAAGTGVNTTGAAIAATTPQYGAHRAHLEQSAYGAALPCASCHAVPAAGNTSHATGAGTGGALATLTWSTLASGTVDPWSSGTPAAPSYTRAAGCASTYCHGQFRNGQTGKTLVWAQDITLTCNSCHGTAGPNPATPPGGSHPANSTCATCHTGYTGTTVNLTTHMNGRLEAAGGDCTGCHNSAQGTRRAIVPEFAGAWSHKRSAAGAVTKFDCAVCHMEGDPTTGDTTAAHQGTPGGNINLRDPDLGTEILGVTWGGTGAGTYTSTASPVAFTRFSRNLGSATLEPAVQAIMINQCLKCHDANGANSPLARVPTTGTAAKPFGTTIAGAGYTGAGVTALGTLGGVTDVSAAFAATNSSYHPVRGKQNNSYVGNARMYAPWNALSPAKVAATTTSYGYLISCWDCHAPVAATGVQTSTVTAHGGAATLRRSVWVQSTTDNLCIVCHNTTAGSNDHGAGSAWASGGNSTPGSRARDACYFCHSSSIAKPARPIPAQDAHGFNAFAPAAGTDTMWPVGATNTYRPYGFMRSIAATGGRWSGTSWRPSRTPELTSGSATCGGSGSLGTGCGSENHGTYTPGGVY